jgi:hypothetical protein
MEIKTTNAVVDMHGGEGEALILRWGIEDKDHDISEKGWTSTQTCPLLIGHDWRSIPVGSGVVRETAEGAVYSFKLHNSPRAQELREWLLHDLRSFKTSQWSYGFTIRPGGSHTERKDGCQVRYLHAAPDGPGCTIHECSSVLVGSGMNTQTLSMRGYDRDLRARHETVLKDIADRSRVPPTDPLIRRCLAQLRRSR